MATGCGTRGPVVGEANRPCPLAEAEKVAATMNGQDRAAKTAPTGGGRRRAANRGRALCGATTEPRAVPSAGHDENRGVGDSQ